jgi:hypothetical protein
MPETDPHDQSPRGGSARRALRFAPIIAPWLIIAAIAIGGFIYVRSGGAPARAAIVGAPATGDAAGIARALDTQGIKVESAPAPDAGVPGALTQGFSGGGGHAHDRGKHPTFAQVESLPAAQLLPLFPANTVSPGDLPELKEQVEQVRSAAELYPTIESAKAAGYVNTTSDVPFMGEHYLNFDLVRKGVFDPAHPQGLLFSRIGPGGQEQLVGIWFLLVPGINGITSALQPNGFAGNLDLWHAHVGLCLIGLSGASEGETAASCTAKGGTFTADLRWMMHVWVAPLQDNPDGVFAYLNNDLFLAQQAASKSPHPPTGDVP